MAAFVCLYARAAWLYPGGTKSEPLRVGFSLVDNYWCDLLDATTHGGRHNPGRPIAVFATIVLCAGLSVLWWTVPMLFPDARWRERIVRSAGLASAVLTPFVATPWHDLVIDVAGLLGVVAFGVTMSAMGRRGGRGATLLAGSTLGLAVTNFIIWQTGAGLRVLPLIQKAAFAALLCWVVVVSRQVSRSAARSKTKAGD